MLLQGGRGLLILSRLNSYHAQNPKPPTNTNGVLPRHAVQKSIFTSSLAKGQGLTANDKCEGIDASDRLLRQDQARLSYGLVN
jgi:hypothetical protein